MIDALISGRVYGSPTERTTKTGKPFATRKVRVLTSNGETVFANAIAFAPPAIVALLALQDGDSAALSGELNQLKTWTDKEGHAPSGHDMVSHAVITTYHVNRTRQDAGEEAQPGTVSSAALIGKLGIATYAVANYGSV
jgi:hypothetical protein